MGLRNKTCGLIGAVVGISWTMAVTAADWQTQATLKQQLSYNDNMRLSTTSRESVFGYGLNPGVAASRKTEDLTLGVEASGDIRRTDNERWDCDNYAVETADQYHLRRNGFGFVGGYSQSCVYLQQLGDTGLLAPKVQYRSFRLAPSWNWQWTARDQLVVDATYSKTDYNQDSSNLSSFFRGNETVLVNAGGNHQWDPRLSLNGGLFFSDIRYTDGLIPEQKIYGLQLGANYDVSRTLKISLGGGPRWVDSQSIPTIQGVTRLGHVVNVRMSYEGVINRFMAGYSNSINPSAIGEVLQYQSLFGNYTYRLQQDISLNLDAQLSRMESIAEISRFGTFNRDYMAFSAGMNWQFTNDLELMLRYGYRYQQYDAIRGTALSNSIMLGLNYNFDVLRNIR